MFITSQKILSHGDAKTDSNLNIKRFANIAKIANKEYLIEFVLKDNKELRIYSIDVIEQKSSGNEKTLRNNSKQHDTAINSIAHIQDVFKTKLVQQYNNDYKNASFVVARPNLRCLTQLKIRRNDDNLM